MAPFLKNPHYKESRDILAERRERFERLNEEARAYGAWVISTPGHREVTIEVLPSSGWPAVLRRRYRLEPLDDGQRILPNAIREPMAIGANGELAPLVPGSTMATTIIVHHAGIHKTTRFSFDLP
jgi:hypothetical protein